MLMERRTLALDPGTRFLGYALFDGHDLIYHGVLTVPVECPPWDRLRLMTARVARMLHDFQPGTLALEGALFRVRRAALMQALVRTLIRLGHRRCVTTLSYAPSTVKKVLTGHGHASKEDVWRIVIDEYPELRPYVLSEPQWRARFHGNMLDAVAVGLMVLHERHSRVEPIA